MNPGQPILPPFLSSDECRGEDAGSYNSENAVLGECTCGDAHTPTYEENGDGLPADIGRNPDLWLYRERTIALLKRYLRISIEVGRLPSLLGRELFRSKVTSYRMSSFEDAVIFVHDVERTLDHLDSFGKDLVAVIIFQDYSQDEAAEVLHCARRTVCREFPEAVDKVSDLFLEGGLLNRLPPRRPLENSCQGGQNTHSPQAYANKPNINLQSMAQLPFQNAILKIESKKKERAGRALFIFTLRGFHGNAQQTSRSFRRSFGAAAENQRISRAKCASHGATGD
jgi:hypothetical protein